jgi:PAS domain S-box-containing protein
MDVPIDTSCHTSDDVISLRQRVADLEQTIAQQRLADAALSERQVHFQTLYEDTPAMVFVLSCDGTILSLNRYGAEQLGYTPEELVGQSVLQIFDPTDHHAVLRQLTVCGHTSNSTLGWELQKVRKDGSRLWVRETARTVRNAAGSPTILVVCEDITTRKTAEEELRLMAQKLQALIHACPLAVMSLDNEGETVTLWNPAAEAMFGWQADETVGRPTPFLCPSQHKESGRMWDELITRGSLSGVEFRRVRKDGTPIDISMWATVLKNERGAVTDTLGFLADITARKQVEASLRESEQAIRTLQEAISCPTLTFDQRILAILELGCRRFKLPTGLMTRVQGDNLVITHVSSRETTLTAGMIFPLEKTYCHTTLSAEGPVCFEQASASAWRNHPGHAALGLECYIGTKLIGLNSIHGTICFVAPTPYATRFTDADKDFLLLMAQWIGHEQDRQESEWALKRHERLLRAVIDTATDAIFMKDTKGRYQLINAAGARTIGKPVEEVVGRTDRELFPPETAKQLMENDQQVLIGGRQHHFEAVIPFQGEPRTFSSIKTPHRDHQGNVIGLVGVSRDITDQKLLEEQRAKSDRLFASFMENLPGLAWIKDTSGRYVYLNGAFQRAFDVKLSDWKGKTDFDVWPETVADQFTTNDRHVLTTSTPILTVETAPRLDGVHASLISKFPIPNEQGSPILVGGIAVDITERKQAEEALRQSEARLHRFVADAPVGLVIKDAQKRILSANKAFCSLTGYTEAEIIGSTYALYTHPDDLPESLALTDEFFRGERPGYAHEKRYVRKPGDIIWVAVKTTSTELPGHVGPLLLAVVEDITQRKQATDERERISRDLHDDVLQSLYAVGMGLEATKERLKPISRSVAKRLEGSVAQLNGVIHEVRSFIPRLQTSSHMDGNFEQALRSLVGSFTATGAGDIAVTIDAAAAAALPLDHCRDVISIAKEAISNSLRHANARRRTVTFHRHRNKLRLDVTDNGSGFRPSRSRRGLGLSNMRTRAKKLGARLTIDSAPGQGTRIVLDLPLK